jgi:hypothetical protein
MKYWWRTYFTTDKVEISPAVAPSLCVFRGSCVRRHFSASEFANSIPPFFETVTEYFPRKKKAAIPVRAHRYPLALSGLQKNGSQ